MSEWIDTTLGKFLALQRGHDLPKNQRLAGEVPVVGSGGFTGLHNEAKASGPGVTIGRAANLGVPTLVEQDFWPLNTTLYVKDFRGNNVRFVFHLFQVLDLAGFNSGSVQPMLNRNYIASFPIRVPDRHGQDAIAEVLGSLDDKIAVNERTATVARSLAVSLGNQEISQVQGESAPLGNYVSLVKGNSYKSADVGHGTQWLVSLKSIGRDGSYRPSGLKRFAGDFKPQQRLESGEVVVAHTDLTQKAEVLARPVRIPEIGPDVHVASLDLAIVRPSLLLTNEYLLALLAREDFRNHALGFSNGTTVLHLSVKAVPSYEFVPPGEDLVGRVTAKMRPLLKRADAAEKESETLSVLRDTLLPQLMSGRLRVKDAEKIVEDHV